MARRDTNRRLKRGELEVVVVPFEKADFGGVPPAHLAFYLVLGQLTNEVTMLHSLLLRCMNATRGPRPVTETSLGMALFLTKAICGRIVEAHRAINAKENGRLLKALWDSLPDTEEARSVRANASQARDRLNQDLGPNSSLMRLVRNKLAYHLDQQVLLDTFARMPDDLELADFHTGRRGTTFFGVADTVAALAISHLTNTEDMTQGVADMANAAIRAVGDLQDYADGFQLAFYLVHFGEGRLTSAPRILLKNLPEIENATLGYFMTSKALRA